MRVLQKISTFIKPAWIFPIIVTFCLGAATAGKLSGSSFGPFYDNFLTGTAAPNLIAGNTQPIRSDEWLVITQFTIAQEKAGYPLINNNLGDGKNMSLVTDAPYKEWSVLFKPQNLAFFVMPFENAFAFKWWFLLALLLLAIYGLTLKFLPGKYLTASLISIIGGFAPFVFWWYQSITVLSIAWGCIALFLAMHIVETKPFSVLKAKQHGLLITQTIISLMFVYAMVAFSLLLYPAFQVPVLLVVAFSFAGWFLDKLFSTRKKSRERRTLYKTLFILLGPVCAALLIVGAFLLTRLDAVKALTQTSYPGSRVVISGSHSGIDVLRQAGFNQYRLQDINSISSLEQKYKDNPAASSINQSEMSSYIVIPFLLILPVLLFIWCSWRSKRKIDWFGIALLICCFIFLAHIFVPNFSIIMKLLGLYLIPIPRLQIGIGLLGIMILIHIIKNFQQLPAKFTPYIYSYGVFLVVLHLAMVIAISKRMNGFAGDIRVAFIAAMVLAIGLALVMTIKYNVGLILLSALSIGSTVFVQPLYVGLGAGRNNNSIVNEISALSDEKSVWAVADMAVLENFPWLANRKAISGVHPYPDKNFWSRASNDEETYNRYAHVLVSETVQKELTLVQPDVFIAKLSCSNHVGKTVTHVLAAHHIDLPCYKLVGETTVASGTFLFYQRVY